MINCINVKLVSNVQNLFTITKLAALTLIILTGIILMIKGDRKFIWTFSFDRRSFLAYLDSFDGMFERPNIGIGQLALAFYSGLWAYK
jgi:amino acid transporter